jgi:hypothetical protein
MSLVNLIVAVYVGSLVRVADNVLQLGAVCVGLWEGNCAKVLLAVVA